MVSDIIARDVRPYAEVTLIGRTLTGLISCNGRRIFQRLTRISFSDVRTAGGQNQKVIGKVTTHVKFKDQYKLITLYIVPSLVQSLYLIEEKTKKAKAR